MTESRALVVAASRGTLHRHARSFRWAAAFLSRESHDDAAVLYAFCRAVDDAVDEAPSRHAAAEALTLLEEDLAHPRSPLMHQVHRLTAERGLPIVAAEQLIAGVRSDLDPVRIADDRALLRYCYLAAGTVGLMMCSVLGVEGSQARAHAIDLGVAMQLTNICRDVRQDAEMGRVYLPASRLQQVGLSQDDLLAGTADRDELARVVRDLLQLAERYYASADAGMRYIPARARLAVLVASRVYRAIGRRLLHRHAGDAWHGRTIVPAMAKAWWVSSAIVAWLGIPIARRFRRPHEPSLHLPLGSLPRA